MMQNNLLYLKFNFNKVIIFEKHNGKKLLVILPEQTWKLIYLHARKIATELNLILKKYTKQCFFFFSN